MNEQLYINSFINSINYIYISLIILFSLEFIVTTSYMELVRSVGKNVLNKKNFIVLTIVVMKDIAQHEFICKSFMCFKKCLFYILFSPHFQEKFYIRNVGTCSVSTPSPYDVGQDINIMLLGWYQLTFSFVQYMCFQI